MSLVVRILVVEDERKTAAFIQKGLREHGFAVDVAENGRVGLAMASGNAYALAILDVMMPERDGWEVMAALRAAGSRLPVLFLSACDDVADRVKGLELGAEDYLVKPFAFTELLARVRTILRRGAPMPEDKVRVADLEIDASLARATRSGRHLHLTPKELQLLLLLARSAGQPVSRAAITQTVWGLDFDTGTNTVEAAVRRLREKMDDPFAAKLIHTVRGIGYMLQAE